jgi:putative holliday junction resolvase
MDQSDLNDHSGDRRSQRGVRALGIDVGTRRIGVAISDATGTLARPLTTIMVDDVPAAPGAGRKARRTSMASSTAVDAIVQTIAQCTAEEDGLGVVVVGVPTRLDGSPTDATAVAADVISALRARISIPVIAQDERLTSHEAEQRLAIRERDWRRRKARLDAAAAAVLLQDYLDHR